MRVINLLSMVALGKIEEPLLFPFDTLDLHHILDKQISQDAIIDQINNDELSFALATGNILPLGEVTNRRPKLENSFVTGWTSLFFNNPFDPYLYNAGDAGPLNVGPDRRARPQL